MNSTTKLVFNHLDNARYEYLDSKDTQEILLKWSIKDRISRHAFYFDTAYKAYHKDDFVRQFLRDDSVRAHFQMIFSNGNWTSLNVDAHNLEVEEVPCSVISLSFFDRFYESGIARTQEGHLQKCFDEFYEDFTISDELRKLLLKPDESDHNDLFTEGERSEFIFRLFTHLCLGGSICQYEENLKPYLSATKSLYKDLVNVQKDDDTGKLHVSSKILKISASDADGNRCFPSNREHVQDFCYLIIDPLRRRVTSLYHCFGSSMFSR